MAWVVKAVFTISGVEEAWRITRQLATRERLLNKLIPPY
jgi:hypothetical protein